MPKDPFSNNASTSTSQSRRWAAITASDAADLDTFPRAIRCNGAGNLVLRGTDGVDVTFAVSAGETLPLQPSRVMATGTTATGIVALF